MVQEQTQPQVEDVQPTPQPGLEGDQVVEPAVDAQPGAEETAPAPGKTYSEKEWSEREQGFVQERAGRDRQLSQAQRAVAEQAMQQQIVTAETQYQAQDRKAVEDGEITEAEVGPRQQRRQVAWERQLAQQAAVRQERLALDAAGQSADEKLRMAAATEMAKEYNVSPADLLKDDSTRTLSGMLAKALGLKNEKLEAELKIALQGGGETYDAGQVGGAQVSLTGKSPMELAQLAYGDKETQRRNKQKRR